MVTGYPRRQETCVIDYYYGYFESLSEAFENISEIAYITCTGYDHSNGIFFDTFCQNGFSFSVGDREIESFIFIGFGEVSYGFYEEDKLPDIFMLIFTIYRDERYEFFFFLKRIFTGISETTIPFCTEGSF